MALFRGEELFTFKFKTKKFLKLPLEWKEFCRARLSPYKSYLFFSSFFFMLNQPTNKEPFVISEQ